MLVHAVGSPFAGYLKPLKRCDAAQPRAANEKICADLAYELGLPVAPVLLYRRTDCPEGQEERACISLVVADETWPIHLVEPRFEADPNGQLNGALAVGSGIVAFDTWVGNIDRNNGNNIVLCSVRDPDSERFVFIDHAFTLNHDRAWEKDDGGRIVRAADLHHRLRDVLVRATVSDTVARIEGLSADVIRSTVARIPNDFLPAEQRDRIAEWLVFRQGGVREALSGVLSVPDA